MSELDIFSRSRLAFTDPIEVDGVGFTHQQIISRLREHVTEERWSRLQQVVDKRTCKFITVLENIYDLGNISAVFRSAEAFGFLRAQIISHPEARFKSANRVARGAEKWLDIQVHQSTQSAVQVLRDQGVKIYATHLEASVPITEIDFTKPTAIVLGNEKDGVSPEMLEAADGRVIIPMQGFSQSFNISVAAALIFYQAWFSRAQKLGQSGDLSEAERNAVLANYLLRCFDNPGMILKR